MKKRTWPILLVVCLAFVISCDWTSSTLGLVSLGGGSANRGDGNANSDDDKEKVERTDPVLFEGWDKPLAALFISGRQHGYIEPCGCTGLENQKGGLLRRHTLMKQLKAKGWDLLPIDSGNQIRRFGRQPVLKLETTLSSLVGEFDYQVISYGKDDVKIPLLELLGAIENIGVDFDGEHPFVCANIKFWDERYARPYRVLEAGGKRIAVTAVLGDEYTKDVKDDLFESEPMQAALTKIVPKIEAENPDLKVLIINASTENMEALIKAVPKFDLVIATDGAGEPTQLPERFVDEATGHVTQKIQVGTKGMYVGVVGLFEKDGKTLIRYQRIPLDDRFDDSAEMKVRFTRYQDQLERMTLSELGINPVAHPSGRKFVGSEVCSDCHEYEYEIWAKGHPGEDNPDRIGPHFRATLSLTEPTQRVWVKRHHDPECLSCHVTGWHPQNYYPYQSGYLKLADELMHGNGCENCHGPGSVHVEVEDDDSVSGAERKKRRLEMRVTLEEARRNLCQECHDLDNSPDFHKDGMFEKYWKQIEHNKK